MPLQEMSLEEYEAVVAERKAALNRAREQKAIDIAVELKGMKAFAKVEEQVLALGAKKEAKGPKGKALKEVSGPLLAFVLLCAANAV